LEAKYFPQGNLLDTVPAADGSQTCRGIEYGLELLKLGVVYRIGDGRSTRIWRDTWIARGHNLRPIVSIHVCCLWWVHQLIDSQSNSWDETAVRRFFYPFEDRASW
jgi:hypothetical protein